MRVKPLALVLCCWALDASPAPTTATEQDLGQLDELIGKLEARLSRFRDNRRSLEKALRASETAISRLHRDTAGLQREARALNSELLALNRRREQQREQLTQQQQLIATGLRSAYQLGRTHSVKVLFNQQDPALMARALTYSDYVNRARMEQIAAFAAAMADARRLAAEIDGKVEQLADAQDKLTAQRSDLEQQQAQRQRTLATLALDIDDADEQLARQRRERRQLERLLARIAAEKAANTAVAGSFQSRKGRMRWPTPGKLSNRFGARRHQSDLRWQGVTISAEPGAGVRAIHAGRVVFSDWMRGHGMLLIIDHGDGYLSLYSHNQSLLHEAGSWVSGEQLVATVGDSGGQLPSGLYFEIRHRGKAENPAKWCKS